jgi:hypothetical protein
MSKVILVVGSGRCGLASLTHILKQQPHTQATLEEPPLLPWDRAPGDHLMRARLARFRKARDAEFLCDTASFYLPYLEDALAADPEVRIIGLKRPREEVVASFNHFLDEYNVFPTNHWAREPAVGTSYDPLWTQTFPQYDTADRSEGIRRYWNEYDRRLGELAERHPQNVRVFDMAEGLNSEAGQREMLTFAGFAPEQQVLKVGARVQRTRPTRGRRRHTSNHPLDPGRCVVLVPYTGFIYPPCEAALRELERRGYEVRRVGGYAAIDQGRNQLATDALLDGFEETMWIDADMEFDPAAVEQLRAHGLPVSCGVYPQKGRRVLTCHVLPGTPRLVFGRAGGLTEVLYAATGFLHVRREVYLTVQRRLALPLANERFGAPMIPFFYPMLHESDDGTWYLAEDFAFSQRVRQSGFKLVADTSIRLWHIGTYPYSWEDAGIERERTATFTLNFPEKLVTNGR